MTPAWITIDRDHTGGDTLTYRRMNYWGQILLLATALGLLGSVLAQGPTQSSNNCDPPCLNGGQCTVNNTCICTVGYTDRDCGSVDLCSSFPCKNGGACNLLDQGYYNCDCQSPYIGRHCEVVDECEVLQCQNEGFCVRREAQDGGHFATCNCRGGFIGETCSEDIDECARGACLNGGTCINNPGGYTCNCPPNTSGRVCEILIFTNGSSTRVTACDSNPCGNNGQCQLTGSADLYTCRCYPGWSGNSCDTASCSREDNFYSYSEYDYDYGGGDRGSGNRDLHYYDYYSAAQVSEDYCLFGGDCSIKDENQLPECVCKRGYFGPRCGYRSTIVENVQPLYGPQAGGTLVTITGLNLNYTSGIDVEIGGRPCSASEGNFTSVVCRTINGTGSNKGISIYWPDTNTRINYTGSYNYRPNPILDRIEPLASIISGGVLLTVYGQNMDSVAKPVLVITMVFQDDVLDRFYSDCVEVQPEWVVCPTPNITILNVEGNFTQQGPPGGGPYRRKKRDLYAEVASLLGQVRKGYEIGGESSSTWRKNRRIQQRWRRQTDGMEKPFLVNDDEITFYIGLQLDGYNKYTNVSEELPEFGQLDVFIDPKVERWGQKVKHIDSDEDRRLEMMGERLDVGLKLSQYRVFIGAGECSDLQLFSNRLVCMAPDSPPPQNSDDEGPRLRVHVQIGIGRKFDIGELEYKGGSFFDNPVAKWGIIGAAIVLAVIILVAIVACVVRKRC